MTQKNDFPEADSNEEIFSDNSGAISMILQFDPKNGMEMMELWSGDGRKNSCDTDILVTNLSRNRLEFLMMIINLALKNANKAEGVRVEADVRVLLVEFYQKLETFITDPVNIVKSVDAKKPFVGIAMLMDRRRRESLQAQREIVLSVLESDALLSRC